MPEHCLREFTSAPVNVELAVIVEIPRSCAAVELFTPWIDRFPLPAVVSVNTIPFPVVAKLAVTLPGDARLIASITSCTVCAPDRSTVNDDPSCAVIWISAVPAPAVPTPFPLFSVDNCVVGEYVRTPSAVATVPPFSPIDKLVP